MVDSIGGFNPANTQATQQNRPQSAERGREERNTERAEPPRDEVSISQEAQDVARAEQQAAQAREALAQNPQESLGLDPNFERDESGA